MGFFDVVINNKDAILRDARNLKEQGSYELAINKYDKYLDMFGFDISVLRAKYLCLNELRSEEDKIEWKEYLLTYNVTDMDKYDKGVYYYEMEDYESAIECFDKSIDEFPNFDNAYYRKGLCYLAMNRYEESLEPFKMALNINSFNDSALYSLENACDKLGISVEDVLNDDIPLNKPLSDDILGLNASSYHNNSNYSPKPDKEDLEFDEEDIIGDDELNQKLDNLHEGIQETNKNLIPCPKCGAELEESDSFCYNCGLNLAKSNNFCQNCGFELREGDVFCRSCGTKVINEIRCAECGTKLKLGDLFCKNCGKKLE